MRRLLITAGPTREMLDPVRFLSNLSTGEMGYALAREARRRRYRVTLVSGPTSLGPPQGVRTIAVTSAREMQQACRREFPRHDALIMTAAVCDFTASRPHRHKIHRVRQKRLALTQTPDIVAGLARRKGGRIVIGFCLETRDWIANARRKMRRKGLDGIVANVYRPHHVPFGDRPMKVAFLDRRGRTQKLRRLTKPEIARRLLHWLEGFEQKGQTRRVYLSRRAPGRKMSERQA